MSRPVLPAFLLGALIALLPDGARAHPHAWIDLRTSAIFDDAGLLTGVHVDWLFDDFYSLFILEELGSEGTVGHDALMDLARRNLDNLAEYSYFTFIAIDGAKLDYAPVLDLNSEMRDGRLAMEFTVPLAEPVDPRTDSISYAVYDPTYYIEILHVEEDGAIGFAGAAPQGCQAELEKPNPRVEDVALAAALDQTESGGDGLGVLFAERVLIRCAR